MLHRYIKKDGPVLIIGSTYIPTYILRKFLYIYKLPAIAGYSCATCKFSET